MQKIDKLKEIIIKAGEIALEYQEKLIINQKDDKSYVSNGDIETSIFLENELKNLYIDYDILSEENLDVSYKNSKMIVIDPIDGTESYIKKEKTWCILIGFMNDNDIEGGIIYQPTEKILYYAFKNQGAFCEKYGQKFKIESFFKEKDLIGLRSYSEQGEDEFFRKHNIKKIIPSYSAALKIMEVAIGNAYSYANFRKKCSIWDLIAPLAILNEAGGCFFGDKKIDKNTLLYDSNFVCSTKNHNFSLKKQTR